MDKIAEFVLKKRVVKDNIEKPTIPWYKRPIEHNEFSYRKAKNGKLYVRHNEWSSHTWIGPYNDLNGVNDIVDSYVKESLITPLDRKSNKNIHSVIVGEEFFEGEVKNIAKKAKNS